MVKQDALMESLSSNLHGFLNQINGNLSVPDASVKSVSPQKLS